MAVTHITMDDRDFFLSDGLGDETLDGGDGNDSVLYALAQSGVTVDLNVSGPQLLGEGLGSHTLIGIENISGSEHGDVLLGDAQVNELAGLGGDDVLAGGGGDDLLTGGQGGDHFKFTFSTGGGEARDSFTEWLGQDGLSLEGASEKFLVKKYTEYLNHLVEKYDLGEDKNGDGKVKVKFHKNDEDALPRIEGMDEDEVAALFGDPTSVAVITGHHHHHLHWHGPHGHKHDHTQERWYSDSFTMEGGGEQTVSSADGKDTILDFEWGTDKLDFSGLGAMTLDAFLAAFHLAESDENADDVLDTVVALEGDSSWSVTLIGINGHTEEQLYEQIKFA